MRPVRLQIQGFTCYREKQEIDFSKLGLFAIAGPTGAGKSSILDAIAFSLYGKVPRLGGQNLDEFISLGAPSASVLFEFDLHHERYRVARTMRRNGTKKVLLEQISTGVPKPLCDSVTEANATVESLLGLEYNAFIQSVLLPQGQFAKFLQSKPAEQRQILRELLRLGVYERMRKAALERATALAANIESARKLLDGPYAEATPARVAELEQAFSGLQSEKDKADRKRDKLQQRLREIQDNWKLVQERQRRGSDLQKLNLDQPRIASLRETVSRAKQAALILPVLNEAVAKGNAFKRFEKIVPDLEQTLKEAANALQQSETRLQNARLEAGTIPGKQQRVHELTKILPVLTERKRCVLKLGQLRTGLEQSVRNVKDKGIAFDRESKAKDEWNDRHASVLKRQTELNYDASIQAVLMDAQKLAFDVQRSAKEVSELIPEPVQAVLRQAELAFDEATQHLAAVEDQQRRAEDKHAAAETQCEAARDKERAAALRLTLSQGCPCPVCEQPVHKVPAAGISSDVNAATRAVETAKNARDAAIRAANMAREKFSKAQVQVENARNEAVKWEERATRLRKELRDSSEALAVAIKPLECPNGKRIHEFAIQELTRQEKVHAQWQSLANELNQAVLQAQRAESKAAAAAQALETERQNEARLTREIEEAERQIAEYDRDISTVGAPDPERERGTALDQIAAIEQEVKTATELRDRLSNEKNQAELKTTEAKAHMAAAAEQRRLADKAAEESLRAADFASVADVKTATLPPGKIEASENEIAEFDTALNQTVARIGELDHQLKGTKVTEADVTRASEEAKQGQDAATSLAHQIGACENRLKSLRDDTTKAELLRAEHAERTSQHAVLYQLSQDLKGDCFQQHLLEGSFRRLVSGASRRLRDLNERYELTFVDGKFAVIDHDHGSLTRLADTLSGGETFLVSLSLALELSEQVQQAAGAVRLDSLFIDEGFGTLDPETLGTVADAIESLSKTNRMVGVITHVAELHSRLPRLEVRPNGSGSTVQYVEG